MSRGWFFDDEPDDEEHDLYTDLHAEIVLGIKAATIRKWRSRKKLEPKGMDRRGRLMYAKEDLLALAQPRKQIA